MSTICLFLIFISKWSWSPEGQSQCACKALEEKQSRAKETVAAESPQVLVGIETAPSHWNYQGRITVLLLQ